MIWTRCDWRFILDDELNDPGKMDRIARMLGAYRYAPAQLRKSEDQMQDWRVRFFFFGEAHQQRKKEHESLRSRVFFGITSSGTKQRDAGRPEDSCTRKPSLDLTQFVW